jgi:hypothetical protein
MEKFREIAAFLKRTDRKLFSNYLRTELNMLNRSKEMFVKIDHNDYSDILFSQDQIKYFFMPSRSPSISASKKKLVLQSIFYLFTDIEHFEKKHGKPKVQMEPDFDETITNHQRKEFEMITENTQRDKLSANDARELGRLKNEKRKWDDSISAAVKIGISCQKLQLEGHEITRANLTDEIFKLGYKKLPDTTIDKIWKAIPESYRKKAGRPSKEKEKKY